MAATACEQGNTTVLTITSDHLTGNFLRVPHNGAGRPRIGLFHETNGWLSLFKCKAKPKSLVTRNRILGKIGAQSFLGKLEISSARVQKLSVSGTRFCVLSGEGGKRRGQDEPNRGHGGHPLRTLRVPRQQGRRCGTRVPHRRWRGANPSGLTAPKPQHRGGARGAVLHEWQGEGRDQGGGRWYRLRNVEALLGRVLLRELLL